MKFKLFIFLTFTFITHSLFANVGSYIIQGTGGSLLPIKNNSINMEKEEIKINVFLLAFNSFQINYDCTFYLKNATDSKQTTLIGFPHKLDVHMIQGNSREAGYVVASKDPAIEDFKFIINEREISFGIYPVQLNPDLSTVPAYDVVYATELAFSPGENKIIKITFTINKYLNCIPTPMGYPLEDRENIEYILKTGLTWKNPIGKADIIINFHFPEKYITVSGKPEGYSINENPLQIKYSFSNFVPSEDIKLDFAFNKLSSETAIQQFNYYFDKNDFLTVYYLLEKYDITTLKDIKDRKTKDSIRNLAYKTAYYFYESDYWKAIQLYVIALHHVYSYDPKYFFAFQTLNSIFLKDTKLQQWEHEAEDNAPCYYIMYNIACEYSRYGNIYWAEEWYKGACQINPQLEAYAQNDPDMVNLLRKDTPLIEACKNPNSIDNIKKIINDGANVDEPGKENFTPLMTLFSNMEENFGLLNIQAVKLLIDKKPDYNKKDLKGMTSLHFAIRHYDNFKRVNNRDEYYNELFKIIQIMVKNGASPDLQDNEGKTPLMYAFESNHATQALKYILIDLSKNIDIKDDSGSTVLMYAAKISDETYINKIIKKGADIKAKNNEGKTPFIIACDYFYHDEDIKSLNILIKAGANVNGRDKTGRTPIMYILESNTESESLLREGIKILLNAGADPDIRDFRGLNTFDIAATKNRIKILEDVINEKK